MKHMIFVLSRKGTSVLEPYLVHFGQFIGLVTHTLTIFEVLQLNKVVGIFLLNIIQIMIIIIVICIY